MPFSEYLGMRTAGATITHVHGTLGAITLLAVSVCARLGTEPIASTDHEYLDIPLRRCAWCQAPNQAIAGICEGWTEYDPARGKHCCRRHTQNAAQERRRHATARFAGYQASVTPHHRARELA
jgi:hypothetical protein